MMGVFSGPAARSRLLVVLLALGCEREPLVVESNIISSENCAACDGDCVIENLESDPARHTSDPIDYAELPPVGGPHNDCWGEWQVHTEELLDERWVHNLEHGGVVYLYDCPDGCDEDLATLQALFDESPENTVIVSPYAALDGGFAAVAWGWRLLLSCADEEALGQFYLDHVDQAPESTTSPPPAGCDP